MSTSSLASCLSEDASSAFGGNLCASAPRETKTFDKCPRCKVNYDFLKRSNNVSSKVPLILNCKHTVCEDCIRKLCFANAAACPVCHEKFLVPRAQIDSLTEVFNPHFALIGQLMWKKNSPNRENINLVPTGVTLKNRHMASFNSMEMNSEADDNSEIESVDGEVDVKILSLEFERCPEHSDSFLNIYCETCNRNSCCYCFLENHTGHSPVHLYRLSKEEKAEMTRLKHEMELVLKHLQTSQKKTKQLNNFDLTHVESEIKSYFADLHAKLHLAERNIRKKLLTFKADEPNLEMVNVALKSGISRVSQALRFLNADFGSQVNVRALYDEIQSLKEIPCRLVSDSGSLDSVEFVCEDSLDNIDLNFSLKRTHGLEYSLLPVENWNCPAEVTSSAVTSVSNKTSDSVSPSPRLPKRDVNQFLSNHQRYNAVSTTKAASGSERKFEVIVTHINDLNSFYVQKKSVLTHLRQMNRAIEMKVKRRLCSDDVKIGRIYGVKYEVRNRTHVRRGELMSMVKKGFNDYVYSVFFIDYGNTHHVTVDKLKELDDWAVRKPAFCFECKLTNPDNDTFGANAHLLLPQIISEKKLFLKFIYRESPGVTEVDLLIPSSDGTAISVRDVLLNTSSEKEDFILPKNVKLYKNSKKFSLGQTEQVMVSYVKDPFHISVQLVHNLDGLEKMKNEMTAFYTSHRSSACIPVDGTDAVIKHETEFEGAWHRGTITSVNSSKKTVDVYFVDWGGNATVPWSNVYLLTEQFTKIECQAIVVKLADVQKENVDEPWPQEVIDFLKEQVAVGNRFKMVVNNEELLEVALFKTSGGADICLNTLLVERHHAVSTGNITETLYWPNQANTEEDSDDSSEFCVQLLKKAEDVLIDDEDIYLKHSTRQQVTVLNFESPDLIYVKYLKYKEKDDELDKELQIHYSSCRPTQEHWKLKEYCVIYDAARSRYFRGFIRAVSGFDHFNVYLYDHAREVRVPKKLIYKYEPYFGRFGCYVNKCKLINVKPAGDQGKWSNLALEILQKIFDTYKIIHVALLEQNVELKLFAAVMWYSLTKTPKALEPSRYRFISINKVLIEAGVAFSASSNLSITAKKVERIEDEKDVDESDDLGTGEVAENRDDADKKDWYDMILEDEGSVTSWPKPVPLQSKEFEAVLTCVDCDGCFSVRNEEMQELYLTLEESMMAKFSTLELVSENEEWQPNELCSILFDGKWYRGTVSEILDSDQVNVEMIDFGSDHVVPKTDIFKQLMFCDMPPLVNKVKLFDVHAKYGAWCPDDVNEALKVVTESIKVVIKSKLDDDIPEAEIYTENGLSINDLVVQRCPRLVRYENRVSLINFDDSKEEEYVEFTEEETGESDAASHDTKDTKSSDNSLSYTYVDLPKLANRRCKLTVVNVLKLGVGFFAVLNASNEVNANSEEFASLTSNIQERAQEQPALSDIRVGKVCVCFQKQTAKWARAVIHSIDSLEFGYVLAILVDYGIIEMVETGQLKETLAEWLVLPVYNHMAIINIELVQPNRAEQVLKQMGNLKNTRVTVEIVSKDPLKVHLYDEKHLCYQNLVNRGILKAL